MQFLWYERHCFDVGRRDCEVERLQVLGAREMIGTWTQQAIIMGGLLRIDKYLKTYLAEIELANCQLISARGRTLQLALSNLETKLMDDAAQEMIDKGAV